MDTSGDGRVSIDEFGKSLDLIRSWGVEVVDVEAAFKDVDADGGGSVLFDEVRGRRECEGRKEME